MAKRIENLKVIENKRLTNDFFTLELLAESKLPELKPGQFAQIKIDGSLETFLRRPISIHDVDYERNTFKLLVQEAGKGTKTLSKLEKGCLLNLIYPLGNSFTLPAKSEHALLIGGGCGVAPLLYLGKYIKSNGCTPDILLGFRNSERILEYDEYKKIGEVFLTTEDGSKGEKGFVTNHTVLSSRKYDRIYCCGPDSMMRAVADYCRKNKISCEVSLENMMACGIGACLCCVVDTISGHRCTCTDGPVFNINELKW
ncbi:MAG TPA: dihydroorotate dehydrogenase electron transfer subunit [Bacteroidales bacterium]|nr:dihydroorotate dehydrogenase electron transfer subunit [Bacteroidales bacterium]